MRCPEPRAEIRKMKFVVAAALSCAVILLGVVVMLRARAICDWRARVTRSERIRNHLASPEHVPGMQRAGLSLVVAGAFGLIWIARVWAAS
jgi:hypothetical protein